jgi:hypothetical protein
VKILTGQNACDGWTPHQFANDWVTAGPTGGGHPIVVEPSNVQLTACEAERMRADRQGWETDRRRHGMFWEHWQLGDDGRFTLTDAGQAHLAARPSRARRSRPRWP